MTTTIEISKNEKVVYIGCYDLGIGVQGKTFEEAMSAFLEQLTEYKKTYNKLSMEDRESWRTPKIRAKFDWLFDEDIK
jgi:hypothetical protein